MKTQQLEIKLSNKTEEDIKKARRKSTQAGECDTVPTAPRQLCLVTGARGERLEGGAQEGASHRMRLWSKKQTRLCPYTPIEGPSGQALFSGPGGGQSARHLDLRS